jgi:AmmeMemoRadiSam system protein B
MKTIKEYEDSAEIPKAEYRGFGGIVPHAGWYFSGRTAFSVFYSISKKGTPELIFLFGMHLPPGGSHCIFADDGIDTPLGTLQVHQKAVNMLRGSFDFVQENARSFSRDNTIELQLPFLKYLFPDAKVVTLGISPNDTALAIGEAAAAVSSSLGLKACFIGSTDLTHYGPNYGFVSHGTGSESVRWVKEENDRRIVDAFLKADPGLVLREAALSQNACCPGGAAAAIAGLKKAGISRGALVQYTTSYDIHPDLSFVGYAGIVY